VLRQIGTPLTRGVVKRRGRRHEERERERDRDRGYNNKWVRGMPRNGIHKKLFCVACFLQPPIINEIHILED